MKKSLAARFKVKLFTAIKTGEVAGGDINDEAIAQGARWFASGQILVFPDGSAFIEMHDAPDTFVVKDVIAAWVKSKKPQTLNAIKKFLGVKGAGK